MSKVSINLITWNGAKYIDACLRSVMAQTFKDFSVIIVDNGSSDDTLAIIGERYPHLKIVKHQENLGFAKAHNQAIHWTKSDYVLCLNQDIVMEPNFLQEAVDFMEAHPMAGAIAGKLLRWQEGEKTKYIDSVGLKIYKNFRVIDLGTGEMDDGRYDLREEVFGLSGALPLYRRKALEETSYQQEFFDESFFSYKEDVDLAFRLRVAGWEIWRVPTAVAYHDRTVKTPHAQLTPVEVARNRRGKSKFANFYSYRNHLYFLIKCLPRLTFSVLFYELTKFFYVLIFETKNLRAWRDVFHNLKQLKLKRAIIWKNRKVEVTELEKWWRG